MICEWYSQVLKNFIWERCISDFGRSGKTTWKMSICFVGINAFQFEEAVHSALNAKGIESEIHKFLLYIMLSWMKGNEEFGWRSQETGLHLVGNRSEKWRGARCVLLCKSVPENCVFGIVWKRYTQTMG